MFNIKAIDIGVFSKQMDPAKIRQHFDWQLTSTARKARTLISKQIRIKYTVRADRLGGSRVSNVAIRKAKNSRVLLYRAHMIGLEHMRASRVIAERVPSKKPGGKPRKLYGVNVTVKKGRRRRVKGGFLGKSRDGRRKFVYARVPGEKTSTGKDKLERKLTISVAHMVGQVPIVKNSQEVHSHFTDGFFKRLRNMK